MQLPQLIRKSQSVLFMHHKNCRKSELKLANSKITATAYATISKDRNSISFFNHFLICGELSLFVHILYLWPRVHSWQDDIFQDNYVVAFEMLHYLPVKTSGKVGYLVLRIDISK